MSYITAGTNLTAHYDSLHKEAKHDHRVWFAHQPTEIIKRALSDIILNDGHLVLSDGLLGQPALIFNPDVLNKRQRKILMRSPAGVWCDVTQATEQEISEIAFGAIQVGPPTRDISGEATLGGVIFELVHAIFATKPINPHQ